MGSRLLNVAPADRADAVIRATRSLSEAELRMAYAKAILRESPPEVIAPWLDVISGRAEQAEYAAREVLLAFVDALQDPELVDIVQRLREEAVGVPLLALERLVRHPLATNPTRDVPKPEEDRVPDYGRGRPLTLGERKSFARKPSREATERLLRDPHPDVIRMLLVNPRVTEDDVLLGGQATAFTR